MAESIASELDQLLETLAGAAAKPQAVSTPAASSATPSHRDAIDDVLASPPRTTQVAALRDAPEVQAFRQSLLDGLIRADTANQLLRLVNAVVSRMLAV